MATSILFPARSIKYAPGQLLLVEAGTAVTYDAGDFVANLTQASAFSAVWDFGDGTIEAVNTTSGATAHTYASPGRYLLTLQTNVGGAVQTTSLQVRALLKASLVAAGQAVAIPWVAAAQTTFGLEDGQLRHAFVLAPLMSAVKSGGTVGEWGTPGGLSMSADKLAMAVDEAATRWQHAWSTSFGRMPPPTTALEQGIWAHCTMDAVPVGISSTLSLNLADLETAWRELERSPGEPHRIAAVVRALTVAGALPASDLANLQRLDRSPTTYLDSGERTVAMAEIMRWLEYAEKEADDSTAMGTQQLARWRRVAGATPAQPPRFDAATAWAWEVAQAAMQTVHAFYFSFAGPTSEPNAQSAVPLVLVNPLTGQATLRVMDSSNYLWFEVHAGPVSGADACPSLADMVAAGGPGYTGWVGARGVGAAGSAAAPTGTFDLGRIQSLFDPDLRRDSPTMGTLALTTTPQRIGQQTGLQPTVAVVQDGALRKALDLDLGGGAHEYVVDVVRPAEWAASYDAARGGLRPHAALAVTMSTRAYSGSVFDFLDRASGHWPNLSPALPIIDDVGTDNLTTHGAAQLGPGIGQGSCSCGACRPK